MPVLLDDALRAILAGRPLVVALLGALGVSLVVGEVRLGRRSLREEVARRRLDRWLVGRDPGFVALGGGGFLRRFARELAAPLESRVAERFAPTAGIPAGAGATGEEGAVGEGQPRAGALGLLTRMLVAVDEEPSSVGHVVESILWLLLGAALLGAAGLVGLVRPPLPLAALAVACVGALPTVRLWWRWRRWRKRFVARLLPTLDRIVIMLSTGYTIEQALRTVAEARAHPGADPARADAVVEFIRRVAREATSGRLRITVAFARRAARLQLPQLLVIAHDLREAERQGYGVATMLESRARALREEGLNRLRAEMGQNRVVASILLVLGLLPPAIALIAVPIVLQTLDQLR